jgi:hypothetical protein
MESFHEHLNEQFYSAHPNIYVFYGNSSARGNEKYMKMRNLDPETVLRKMEKGRIECHIERIRNSILMEN